MIINYKPKTIAEVLNKTLYVIEFFIDDEYYTLGCGTKYNGLVGESGCTSGNMMGDYYVFESVEEAKGFLKAFFKSTPCAYDDKDKNLYSKIEDVFILPTKLTIESFNEARKDVVYSSLSTSDSIDEIFFKFDIDNRINVEITYNQYNQPRLK